MKFLDRITKRFATKASTAVKTEVKKTIIDLIPTALAIAAAAIGVAIFKSAVNEPEEIAPSFSTHTTNNYFFRDMSEESIRRLMEGK